MRGGGLLRSLVDLAGIRSGRARNAPRAARSAVLEYGRTRFVKSYRENVEAEFLRGEAIHGASVHSGLFRAPAPLALLAPHDLIVWEYLDGLVELREEITSDVRARPGACSERCELFTRAGRALAAIHEALAKAGTVGEYWPFREAPVGDARLDAVVAERLERAPRRPLHWDFVCGNLFVRRSGTQPLELAVLDASPNWYLAPGGELRATCPVYVDAATLAFSLWCHPRFSPVVRHEVDAYLGAFLAGYAAGSGFALDPATVMACGARVARSYQDYADRAGDSHEHRKEKRFRLEAARRLQDEARARLSAEVAAT